MRALMAAVCVWGGGGGGKRARLRVDSALSDESVRVADAEQIEPDEHSRLGNLRECSNGVECSSSHARFDWAKRAAHRPLGEACEVALG